MNMKKIVVRLVLFICFVLVVLFSQGQTSPPPPNGGNNPGSGNDPVGGGAPIGTGLFITTGLAVAWGSLRIYNAQKKRITG